MTFTLTNKTTYAEALLDLIEGREGWVYSYELVSRWHKGKWLGPSCDRIARELVAEGLIERVREGKYVKYRAKQAQLAMF